jgi:asparagine synthase (glutamine-hydrolysing)
LPFGHRVEKMARFVDLESANDFVLYNACEVLPPDLRILGMEPADTFAARRGILLEATALYRNEPVRQAMYLDQHAFLGSLLDRNDRMTMGASIECRVPFLDYRLVEQLASAPSAMLFSGLRGKAMSRRAFSDRLPASVLAHKKWGFGVPWDRYFRDVPELRRLIGMLPALEPIRSGPFARKRVRAVVDGFLRGDEVNNALIFQLAMIAIWHDAYVAA